jgi:hypothetical protein
MPPLNSYSLSLKLPNMAWGFYYICYEGSLKEVEGDGDIGES